MKKILSCVLAFSFPFTAILAHGQPSTVVTSVAIAPRVFEQESSRSYRRPVYLIPAAPTPATTPHPSHHVVTVAPSRHKGYATAVDCVAGTENRGDYGRSSNSNHFGRYQFSRQAWVIYGGNSSTWGIASSKEQDAVFHAAVAAGALQQQWLNWDGC